VRPGQVAGELPEEERRVDRAGAARPDVVEVRDLALEVLAVLVDQRELPEPFAGGPGGVEEALGEVQQSLRRNVRRKKGGRRSRCSSN